ncbi:unnamed protein product [Cylindrotheca closterium]|uniref:Uncharacterized protein n=1 Tax=Cylindrotheca closterium TaxID=2856 RepID=A0AAD2PU52_9STRA|nr:unnamed protein product [Cylindrotheca closterium]
MSESSSRRENDQFSDRKTAQLMTPDKKSAVAPTCNSVMERCSDSHSWIFHRDHRKQQQTSPAEEPNALAICERLQIETREEVWNIGTPPSTPPRIQVASETQVSNAVDSRSMMEFRDSVRGRHLLQKAELGVAINRRKYSSTNACGKSTASESDESKKNDDELLTSQCRVGSAERDSTSFSKSTSPNAAAPPSTQSQRFSADFTGSQGNTEEQPSSCPRTPVSTANDDCDEAEKSITSNHSGDPPAATYGLDSVSTQSNSLEADFSLSSGSADEGMVSPSISLHFSPYAGGVNTGKPLCEALVHLSCDSSRKESSSTLQSKTNMIRRGAGRRSMSRRWEVWNHPLCSLQRLNNLSK